MHALILWAGPPLMVRPMSCLVDTRGHTPTTPFGSFCYVTMTFYVKNTRATYQRCMLKCFGDLIGWTVEAYIDNIMVKSKWADHLIADLEQTFVKLQANGIKLNPEKCVFGVPRGMLLDFIVSE